MATTHKRKNIITQANSPNCNKCHPGSDTNCYKAKSVNLQRHGMRCSYKYTIYYVDVMNMGM